MDDWKLESPVIHMVSVFILSASEQTVGLMCSQFSESVPVVKQGLQGVPATWFECISEKVNFNKLKRLKSI